MLTIGTWNLENLFRPGGQAGPTTDAAYREKLEALAATITELDPDVLAVQEVGDPEALDDLVELLDGEWHTALAEPDDRGIRVGYLSRLELLDVDQASDFPDGLAPVQVDDEGTTIERMGRAASIATVESADARITLVCCHLKSKLLTYPGGRFSPHDEDERARYGVYALGRRAAEAATVRRSATALIDGAGEERSVVVLGDLNDGMYAATTTILHGPPGSEIGTGGFDRPDKGDAERLWNLAPLIPREERYTRIYLGRRELLDHILVSHALLDRVDEVATGPGPIASVTDYPNERLDVPASDHKPVIVRLTTS